jgi:superfamily II DNA or RNA helicase
MSLAVPPPPTLDQVQAEALDAVLDRRRSGSRSSILQMATGLGKTRVAGNYTRHARREWGGRTLFLCDSRELVNQTAAEFKDAGIPFAVEMGPYRAAAALRVADPWAVIGSKDSLYAERIAAFRPDCFSEVVVDEGHLSLAPTWKEVLAYFAPARHVLVLTATPYRFDGQPLYDAPGAPYEGIAYRYRLPEAVTNGHLAEVHSVTRHAGVNLKDVRVSRRTKDFSRGALEDRISRNVEPLVNVVRREIEDLGLKKVLLFSPDVPSALAFAEAFRKVGVPAKGVHGGSKAHPMSDPTRDRIIREHKEGAFPVLCSCDLLTTGYNDPWIEAVVMCRPTKSYGLAMQMAGRCTRRPPGKDHCYVIGFAWEGAEGVVSSVDFFLEDEPDPKVRIIAKRLQGLNRGIPDRELVERAREIAALDAQREAEEEDRRRLRLQVRKKEVHCKRIEFTPFTAGQIVGIAPVVRELGSGAFEPMAESQREFLRSRGMSNLTGLDRAGAEAVIRKILDSDFRRLAGPDQVTELIRAGHSPEVARRMELAKAEDELRRVRQRVEAEAAARAAKQAGNTSKSAAIHHAKPVSPKMRIWLARRGYPPERIDRMGQGEAVRIFLDVTGKGRRARA